MHNGHHHCDQWPKLPQIHISDYIFDVEKNSIFKFRFEFEFEKDLKRNQKEKKKRKRRQASWAGLGREAHLLLSSLPAQPQRPLYKGHLGQTQFAGDKQIKKEKG